MSKILYIMRGIAGSGKSTRARQLPDVTENKIFSTDDLIGSGEKYDEFFRKMIEAQDFTPLADMHKRNLERAKIAMYKGISPIVIDNTNLSAEEAAPYVKYGYSKGYKVKLIDVGTGGLTAQQLAKRNTHNVPIESIERMIEKYNANKHYTVKSILGIMEANKNTEQNSLFPKFLFEGQIEKAKAKVSEIIHSLENRTWIVFDTEATDLDPSFDKSQITEIAAIAIDGKTGAPIEKINYRILLSDKVQWHLKHYYILGLWRDIGGYVKKFGSDAKQFIVIFFGRGNASTHNNDFLQQYSYLITNTHGDKQNQQGHWSSEQILSKLVSALKQRFGEIERGPNMTVKEILDMTEYSEGTADIVDIKYAMLKFNELIGKYTNPVLIAHNARFDMHYVGKEMERVGMKMKQAPVIDTLALARNYLIPILEYLASSGNELAKQSLMVLSPDGSKPKANLGILGKMFGIEPLHWHSGLSDTQQLVGIVIEILKFFKANESFLLSKDMSDRILQTAKEIEKKKRAKRMREISAALKKKAI